jgi:hypothetical protein
MVAASMSQLPSFDWTLAEASKTVRLVYTEMWKLRGTGTP